MVGFGLRFGRKKLKRQHATSASFLALTALKESSDTFPPLKSAVAGVIHIWELYRKVKSNRKECLKLAFRLQEILDKIADATPDASQIPPDLLDRIERFTRTLDDIGVFMETLCHRHALTRLVRHKEDEAMLCDFN